jgi:hypothetical protein
MLPGGAGRREIFDEHASAGDVENLRAAADAEQRDVALPGGSASATSKQRGGPDSAGPAGVLPRGMSAPRRVVAEYLLPPLSTVAMPTEQLGATAVDVIIDHLEADTAPSPSPSRDQG